MANRFHTVAAAHHHDHAPLNLISWTDELSLFKDNYGVRETNPPPPPRSEELHQVGLRHDPGNVALRRDQDGVVVSEQTCRQLDGGFRVNLREGGLHDFVHANPREVLRISARQDQVVDHLVRDRADRMPVVHDRHLGELPTAHLIDRGRERHLRLDGLDLAALDLLHERLLLLLLQLRLQRVHDSAHAVVRRVHLALLDLHDRRLADVREASDRRLCEAEGLPQPRYLLQVGHHRPPEGLRVHIRVGIFESMGYYWSS